MSSIYTKTNLHTLNHFLYFIFLGKCKDNLILRIRPAVVWENNFNLAKLNAACDRQNVERIGQAKDRDRDRDRDWDRQTDGPVRGSVQS